MVEGDLSNVLGVRAGQDRDQIFTDLIGDHTKLILSEENFIGLMVDTKGQLITAALYPKAVDRLVRLAGKLQPHRLHLLLGMRNPATFLVSLYSQALMRGNFQTWDAFVADVDLDRYAWSQMLAPLHESGMFRSITAWPFEEYHSIFDPLMDMILGPQRRGFQKELEARSHEGLSIKAVEACTAWHAQGEVGPLGAVAREDFPVGPDNPKFQPWPDDVLVQAKEMYEADLMAASKAPGVQMLRSDPAQTVLET